MLVSTFISFIFFALLAECSVETDEDCKLIITTPSEASVYVVGTLRADASISFGEGKIADAVRAAPSSFFLCFNWSGVSSCQPLLDTDVPAAPEDLATGVHHLQVSLHHRIDSINLDRPVEAGFIARRSLSPALVHRRVSFFIAALQDRLLESDINEVEDNMPEESDTSPDVNKVRDMAPGELDTSSDVNMVQNKKPEESDTWKQENKSCLDDPAIECNERISVLLGNNQTTLIDAGTGTGTFPCSYSGTFTAIAPWSVAYSEARTPPIALAGPRLDVPLSLVGVRTWGNAETALGPQFRTLCASNFPGKDHASFGTSFFSGPSPAARPLEEAMAKTTAIEAAMDAGWNPAECTADLLRQVKEWVFARCANMSEAVDMDAPLLQSSTSPPSSFSEKVSREASSLLSFRRLVQSELQLSNTEWTLSDIDAKYLPGFDWVKGITGGQEIKSATDDDGCSAIWHAAILEERLESHSNGDANNETEERTEVLIVGNFLDPFLGRQLNFVLRDLLGCIPKARVCIEGDDTREETCEKMLKYAKEKQRIRNAWWNNLTLTHDKSKTEINSREDRSLDFEWSCGSCRDHLEQYKLMHKKKPRVVLISTLSLLSSFDGDNDDGTSYDSKQKKSKTAESSSTSSSLVLNGDISRSKLWRPEVIVHLNDEAATPPAVLEQFYHYGQTAGEDNVNHNSYNDGAACCRLVLRMYRHPTLPSQNTSNCRHNRNHGGGSTPRCNVVTIPVGYLGGFTDTPDKDDNDSQHNDLSQASSPFSSTQWKSGVEAVKASLTKKAAARRHFWSFVGTRTMHHPHTTDSRTAMTNFFSALHPLSANAEEKYEGGNDSGTRRGNVATQKLDHVCHLTDRDGYVSSVWSGEVYLQSRFVASPRGESLDCFRHYEAVVSGAVPIVDQPKDHPAWPWSSTTETPDGIQEGGPAVGSSGADIGRRAGCGDAGDSGRRESVGLLPLPAWPIGWVFPPGPATLPRARAATIAEWPSFCEEIRPPTLRNASKYNDSTTPSEATANRATALTRWGWLAAAVAHIGHEEVDLRRELNARWYAGQMMHYRGLVASALFGDHNQDNQGGDDNVSNRSQDVCVDQRDPSEICTASRKKKTFLSCVESLASASSEIVVLKAHVREGGDDAELQEAVREANRRGAEVEKCWQQSLRRRKQGEYGNNGSNYDKVEVEMDDENEKPTVSVLIELTYSSARVHQMDRNAHVHPADTGDNNGIVGVGDGAVIALSSTLQFTGPHLSVFLCAAAAAPSQQQQQQQQPLSRKGADTPPSCVFDGGSSQRVLSVTRGAWVHLCGVHSIRRGFAHGDGAGARVTGPGSLLTSGPLLKEDEKVVDYYAAAPAAATACKERSSGDGSRSNCGCGLGHCCPVRAKLAMSSTNVVSVTSALSVYAAHGETPVVYYSHEDNTTFHASSVESSENTMKETSSRARRRIVSSPFVLSKGTRGARAEIKRLFDRLSIKSDSDCCLRRPSLSFEDNEVAAFSGGGLYVGGGAAVILLPRQCHTCCDDKNGDWEQEDGNESGVMKGGKNKETMREGDGEGEERVDGVSFRRNIAGAAGGAVAVSGAGSLLVLVGRGGRSNGSGDNYGGITFLNNRAYRGGAAAISDGAFFLTTTSIDESTGRMKDRRKNVNNGGPLFQGNSAFLDGGSMYVNSASVVVAGALSVIHLNGTSSDDYEMLQEGRTDDSNDDGDDENKDSPIGEDSDANKRHSCEESEDGEGALFLGNRVSMGGSAVHATNGARVALGAMLAPPQPTATVHDSTNNSFAATMTTLEWRDKTTIVRSRAAPASFFGNTATYGGLFSAKAGAGVGLVLKPLQKQQRCVRQGRQNFGEKDTRRGTQSTPIMSGDLMVENGLRGGTGRWALQTSSTQCSLLASQCTFFAGAELSS